MNYDLSQCGNLEWKSDNYTGTIYVDFGVIKIISHEAHFDKEKQKFVHDIDFVFPQTEENTDQYLIELPGFKITPRDPKRYSEFKVGDVVKDENGYIGCIVFSSTSLICVCWNGDNFNFYSQHNPGLTLILTPYEEKLKAQIKKEKICSFKPGDKVVGRDTDNDNIWDFGIFERMEEYDGEPLYICKFKEFTECVPFNENTYKLLGTENDYGN